ncbi:minor capsid protein [Actinoplanes sp. NPDC048796]|uniref:minor capsid protein n=1 Tax=Actinoplanes sp. NPDC048796 TaxID=3155640 RepID=UPI0033E0417C
MAGDGWTSRLLTGAAQHLAAAGIGTWNPNGVYTDTEVGIAIRAVPPGPDRLITLATYPVTSEPGLADVTEGLQVRVRGTKDPRVVADLGDAVFDLLDSAEGLNWGGVAVVQVFRQSYTSLGVDTSGRWEISHNYYVQAMRPTNHRTD